MPTRRNRPKPENFNRSAKLPFQLRLEDFEIAMQDVYDLFYDVNTGLLEKGLERFDDFLRPAIMSGLLSDLLTASVAKHSRNEIENGVSGNRRAHRASFERQKASQAKWEVRLDRVEPFGRRAGTKQAISVAKQRRMATITNVSQSVVPTP